ncbi:hypothetical protein VaNZ11_015117 [Volvox africanus]|uniref:Anaphase-promoting complex subunit 4 WD40 domain-containing protein n=1 Tax=Volvox africanus TaxID=51714 RepID=A0ABQ5SLG4_9CHLO|nr:hypothetical protein VaNZ11_015117 [Volvox africanus]
MAEQIQYPNDEYDTSNNTAAGGNATPRVDGSQEPASVSRGAAMRIKNLDTGEEYDLEEFDLTAPVIVGRHSASCDTDQPGALNDEEEHADRGLGVKKKAWLRSTKKLKTCRAKTTLTNVKEKIEERIEKQQLQRQLQQQQEQKQRQQQLQQQQQRQEEQKQRQQQLQQQQQTIQDSYDGALAGGTTPHPTDPLEHGAMEGAQEAGAAVFQQDPSLVGGSEGVAVDTSSLGRSVNFNDEVIGSQSIGATKPPKSQLSSNAEFASGSGAGMKVSGGAAGDGSVGSSSGHPSSAAAAAEVTRGSKGLTAAAGKPHVPPLPPMRGLTSQPLGAAVAPPTPAPASAPLAIALADGGGQHQGSEDLRIPLLEEDMAGPSSRAVPTAKSWVNQPARVIGGRRAAGRQLQQVRMVQELLGHDGPVWSMKFSADARLLATAGRDGVLRIWSVYWYGSGRSKLISPAREDKVPVTAPRAAAATAGGDANASGGAGGGAAATRPPLLSESPLLSLPGHRSDVLDLSWSQCRLLLTASADQTARLWSIDVPVGGARRAGGGGGGGVRPPRASGSGSGGSSSGADVSSWENLGGACPSAECLRSFVHPDFVTSCCFHPCDGRCIVTGCADGKIRIWSVPDAAVVTYATVPQDIITRVLFSVDGTRVVAGTLRGKARYYELTGGTLDYLTQLDVKNPHGSGRKVTGLAQVPYSYGNDQLYVITSADSRIRLYVGYTQERKFKGHRHTNTQIPASLSPSCQHLICGSDDGWVYVWETGLPPPPLPGPIAGNAPITGSGAAAGVAAAGGAAAGALTGVRSPGESSRNKRVVKETAAAVRGALKVKEGTFEAFQTPDQTTTVSIFAPNVCRLGRGLDQRSLTTISGTPTSLNGTAAAAPQLPLLGALFVVAGFSGKIYVYENLPAQGM